MDKNILYHRTATQLNILKAFGASPDLQKAVSEVFEKGRTQSGCTLIHQRTENWVGLAERRRV